MSDQTGPIQAQDQNEQNPPATQQPVQQPPVIVSMLTKDFKSSQAAAKAAGLRAGSMSKQRLGFAPKEGKVKSLTLLQEAVITDNNNSHTRDYFVTVTFLGAEMTALIRTWDHILTEGTVLNCSISEADANGNNWLNWRYVANAVKVDIAQAIKFINSDTELQIAIAQNEEAKARRARAVDEQNRIEKGEEKLAAERAKLASKAELSLEID